jgi:hypothetical protein
MPEPIQKEIYAKAKTIINQKYGTKTSAYRSMALVKKYKSMGGKYRDDTKAESSATSRRASGGGSRKTTRWLNEKWVNLNAPKKDGGYEECGTRSKDGKYPLCRPSRTVSSDTPKRFQDISKSRINAVNLKKQKLQNKGNIKF